MEDPILYIDKTKYNVHSMDDIFYVAVKRGATPADLHGNKMVDMLIGGSSDGTETASSAVLLYSTNNSAKVSQRKCAGQFMLGAFLGAVALFGILKMSSKLWAKKG